MTPNIDDYTLACFHNIHVVPSGTGNNIRCTSVQADGLIAGMKALGLASQATIVHDQSLLHSAYKFYGKTIQSVASTLQVSAGFDDATVLAILTLTYFEQITGLEAQAYEAWSTHVMAISTIIHQRGPNQMDSEDGRMLFILATTSIFALHMRTRKSLPEYICDLADEYHCGSSKGLDVVWQTTRNWMSLIGLYSRTAETSSLDLGAVVEEATSLHEKFAQVFLEAGEEWLPEAAGGDLCIAGDDDSRPLHKAYLHRSALATQIWVSARQARLLLRIIIFRSLRGKLRTGNCHRSESLEGCIARTRDVITELQDDILAAAPQYLGVARHILGHKRGTKSQLLGASSISPTQNSASVGLSTFVPLRSNKLPVLRTTRSYNLMWALSTVAESAPYGSSTRQQAIRFMRLLGQRMGAMMAVRQAEKLAKENALP